MLDLRKFCDPSRSFLAEPARHGEWLVASTGACIVAVPRPPEPTDWQAKATRRSCDDRLGQYLDEMLAAQRNREIRFGHLQQWAKRATGVLDPQRLGGVLVDRSLVQRCVGSVRDDDAIATVAAIQNQFVTIMLEGVAFIVVMPLHDGIVSSAGADPLELPLSAVAMGFVL